jgi:hypothetical protein
MKQWCGDLAHQLRMKPGRRGAIPSARRCRFLARGGAPARDRATLALLRKRAENKKIAATENQAPGRRGAGVAKTERHKGGGAIWKKLSGQTTLVPWRRFGWAGPDFAHEESENRMDQNQKSPPSHEVLKSKNQTKIGRTRTSHKM